MLTTRQKSNISIRLIDGTLTSTTILGLSGHESNSNEGALYISQTPKLEFHYQIQFNVAENGLMKWMPW